ncbi:hypothetical protein KJ836_02735 [Patescibacteria group bacterium]|nr:hypothetical protein [Patescibacteria group bacterium]
MAKPQSFKPGDPRINRKGAPKKEWTMTALYKEAGDEADETGVPMKLIVAKKLWKLASKGDVTAIKELGNRIDGMPKQGIDLGGEAIKIDIDSILTKAYGKQKSS